MGDVLSPQSFGLCPPTGGYDSSDYYAAGVTAFDG